MSSKQEVQTDMTLSVPKIPESGKPKPAKAIRKMIEEEEATQTPAPQREQTTGPEQLIELAIRQDVSIEKLEKLMELQARWEERQSRAAFFDALARFQSLVPAIPKTKQGYGYLYAPLGDIDNVIKDSMRDCGLSKTWDIVEGRDDVTVACVITHIGGYSKETKIGPVGWDLLEKTKQMNGLQHRAAVLTYLQRYSLIGALGLTTADIDTDARLGNGNGDTGSDSISDSQAADIEALITEVGADRAKFLAYMKVAQVSEIPQRDLKRALAALEAKRRKGAA